MEIRRIAVGTDFSEASLRAAKEALALARRTGASLVLVHAGPVVELSEPPGIRQWGESAFAARRAAIAELREQLTGQGVEVSTAVHDGSPAEALCAAADEMRADLLVVGSHGAGNAIARFLLGSVAERVVRIARLPVAVVRSTPDAAPLHRGGYRRALVAVDLSEVTDRVVEHATALVGEGAELELFHAWTLPPMPIATTHETPLYAEIRQARSAHAAAELEQLVLRWRHAVDGQMYYEHIEAVSARDAILDRLAGDYDLVVIGSHGRSGLRRWLAGSVAEAVARAAPCTALVVKPPA